METPSHSYGTSRYFSYGITQCYLPPDTSERAPRLTKPCRLVLEPEIFRSRVRRRTAAPPRQPNNVNKTKTQSVGEFAPVCVPQTRTALPSRRLLNY